jgi:hypothetical protein
MNRSSNAWTGIQTEATWLVLGHAFDEPGLHQVDLRVQAFQSARFGRTKVRILTVSVSDSRARGLRDTGRTTSENCADRSTAAPKSSWASVLSG